MTHINFFQITARTAGADPGFLERGFIMNKGVGVSYADFISFFLNIP